MTGVVHPAIVLPSFAAWSAANPLDDLSCEGLTDVEIEAEQRRRYAAEGCGAGVAQPAAASHPEPLADFLHRAGLGQYEAAL
eukprot:gene23119-52807_t